MARRTTTRLTNTALLRYINQSTEHEMSLLSSTTRSFDSDGGSADLEEPRNFREAMKSPFSSNWLEAMNTEIQGLLLNDTFSASSSDTEASLPAHTKALSCRWVFKVKINADGSRLFKARWVVRGYEAVEGLHFEDVYAPVSRLSTVRFVVALSAHFGFKMEHLDVTGAFLHPEIDNDNVWVTAPLGIESLERSYKYPISLSKPLRLKKALYGLKQSPKLWFNHIHTTITRLGFRPASGSDPNLYVKTGALLLLYVDDLLLVTTDSSDTATRTKRALLSTYKMKDLGPVQRFLGIDVMYENNDILLHQKHYVDQVLIRYQATAFRTAFTPLQVSIDLANGECEDKTLTPDLQKHYQSIVGSVMYLALATRPDLSFPVLALSRYSAQALSKHLTAANHLLKYLRATNSFSLRYKRVVSASWPIPPSVVAFTDSDWAGCSETRKSVGGYCLSFSGSSPISWAAKSQSVVAQSTLEAEFIAASTAAKEISWFRQLIVDTLAPSALQPVRLFCDNEGAVKLIVSGIFKTRTKHIDVKYRHACQAQNESQISMHRINSSDNPADLFTKPLDDKKITHLSALILLQPLPVVPAVSDPMDVD